MSDRIQTGQSETVEFLAVDNNAAFITGATDIVIMVRRESDQFILDWSDDTFKHSGWTSPNWTLTEVDSVNCPGQYRLTKTGHLNGFNPSSITNLTPNDDYYFVVFQKPGVSTRASNLPATGELKVGQYLDMLTPLAIASAIWNAQENSHQLAGSLGRALSMVRKSRTNREIVSVGKHSNFVLYDDDSITPILVSDVTGPSGEAISIPSGTPSNRTKGA
jgi:hypothetical protein